MHIAHSLAFNLGYVLGVGLCPVGWQSMHSVSYAWHALFLGKARWFGSSVNVPARTGIECGPTRPSVLGMNCPLQWATKPYLVGYDVLQGYHLHGSWRLGD